jgi:hypothetical protein
MGPVDTSAGGITHSSHKHVEDGVWKAGRLCESCVKEVQ